MENKVAIDLLKHHINTWENKFPSNHFEACKAAIEALEKQIPIKLNELSMKIGPYKSYKCVCAHLVLECEPYCNHCGQKLDWD